MKEVFSPMLKRMRKLWQRYMLRPMLYKAFTRFIIGLCACLLWHEFVNVSKNPVMRSTAFLFMAALLAGAAWMSYLRLDGIRAWQFDKTLFDWKRPPVRSYGDMIDFVDEQPVQYDDLEDDEQCLCLFLADVICAVIFLIISFF